MVDEILLSGAADPQNVVSPTAPPYVWTPGSSRLAPTPLRSVAFDRLQTRSGETANPDIVRPLHTPPHVCAPNVPSFVPSPELIIVEITLACSRLT